MSRRAEGDHKKSYPEAGIYDFCHLSLCSYPDKTVLGGNATQAPCLLCKLVFSRSHSASHVEEGWVKSGCIDYMPVNSADCLGFSRIFTAGNAHHFLYFREFE
jgi:hypothetical protein